MFDNDEIVKEVGECFREELEAIADDADQIAVKTAANHALGPVFDVMVHDFGIAAAFMGPNASTLARVLRSYAGGLAALSKALERAAEKVTENDKPRAA